MEYIVNRMLSQNAVQNSLLKRQVDKIENLMAATKL